MRDRTPSRRAVLKVGGALGTVAALAIAPAAACPGADPAFARIDAHRQALAALTPVLDDLERAELGFGFGSIEARKLGPRIDDLLAQATYARVALLRTVPATNSGMTAIIDYLMQADLLEDMVGQDDEDELALLLTTIRAFVAREARHG